MNGLRRRPCDWIATGCLSFVVVSVRCLAANDDHIPDSYLLKGTVTSSVYDVEGIDPKPNLARQPILVAKSPERVLVGYQDRNNESMRGYIFGIRGISHGLSVETADGCNWTDIKDLANSEGMKIRAIVRQGEAPDDSGAGIQTVVETGVFGEISLAVFFGRATSGHIPAMVRFDDATSEKLILANEYGTLSVSFRDGRHTLRLSKDSADFQSSTSARVPIGDLRSSMFKSGIKSIEETCQFGVNLKDLTHGPWSATCESLHVGNDGSIVRIVHTLEIDKFIQDQSQVDLVIDAFLNRIPDGTEIVTNEKLSYVWSDRALKIVKDSTAIAAVEQLTFEAPSTTWDRGFLLGALLVIGTAVGVFVFRKIGSGNS